MKGFRLWRKLNCSSFSRPQRSHSSWSFLLFQLCSSVSSREHYNVTAFPPDWNTGKWGLNLAHTLTLLYFGHKWKELVCFLVCLPSALGPELSCRFRHEKRHEVPMCTSGIKSRKLGSVLITLYWQEMKVLIPITFRAPVPTALWGVTHFGTFEREFASPPSLPHLYCFCSTDLSH